MPRRPHLDRSINVQIISKARQKHSRHYVLNNRVNNVLKLLAPLDRRSTDRSGRIRPIPPRSHFRESRSSRLFWHVTSLAPLPLSLLSSRACLDALHYSFCTPADATFARSKEFAQWRAGEVARGGEAAIERAIIIVFVGRTDRAATDTVITIGFGSTLVNVRTIIET